MPPLYLDISEKDGTKRAVCDFIAGLNDRYAVRLFGEVFVPKDWHS